MTKTCRTDGDVMGDPCKRLWTAVLKRAVKDVHDNGTTSVISQGTRAWFGSKNQGVGSFLWICSMLDLNPEFVRKHAADKDNRGALFVEWLRCEE